MPLLLWASSELSALFLALKLRPEKQPFPLSLSPVAASLSRARNLSPSPLVSTHSLSRSLSLLVKVPGPICTQPAIIVIFSVLGLEVCAVINYRLFEAHVAGEVVVQPAMARHATGHQELLSGRQIADLLGFAGGIGPGPHLELEYKVVACSEELFWSDEISLTEVSSYA
jgi:hypothetical protein